MTVAVLQLELLLTDCRTIRDRRRRLHSIEHKLRKHWNVAVTEAGRDDDPTHALLVVVTTARTRREARAVLDHVADAVAAHPRAAVLSQEIREI